MHVVTKYPDGVFNWIDLTTTDVAGATPMSGDMQAMGMPPVWVSYVKIDDIDGAAARAVEAGGAVFVPPMDVLDSGRMALVQDPTGAAFGMWSPRAFARAALVNRPNTLAWNELQTRDLPAARAFYKQVFGWTADEMSDGSGYVTFAAGGRTQCGSLPMNEMFEGVPANWAVYFMVEDVEAAAARVAELGGAVLVGPNSAGEMGRFIVVRDPQGAVFTAMQFNGPMDPPPGY